MFITTTSLSAHPGSAISSSGHLFSGLIARWRLSIPVTLIRRIGSGKNHTVTNGHFTETKELVAGFMILQVKSLEEDIEKVKRSPNCHAGESEVEICQVFEPEDFAPAFSEEGIQLGKKSALNWQIRQQRNSTRTDASKAGVIGDSVR